MDTKYPERALATRLNKDALLRIRAGGDKAVVVFNGTVWLTLDDDARDIVLGSGESFDLDGAHGALVQALRDSTVLVVARDDEAERALHGLDRALADGWRWLTSLVPLLRRRWNLGRPPTADPALG